MQALRQKPKTRRRAAEVSVLILGCGGHGREVAWLCEDAGLQIAGFLDDEPKKWGTVTNGHLVRGRIEDTLEGCPTCCVVCAVGNPALKSQFARRALAAGYQFTAPILHPRALVSPTAKIGTGSVIAAGAIISVNTTIGAHVTINMNCTVSHDARLGDFATVNPGCNLSGNVTIEPGAYIGTNAALREGIRVGEGAVVGAGAFVTQDVPPRTLVAGVPAIVKKRYHNQKDPPAPAGVARG